MTTPVTALGQYITRQVTLWGALARFVVQTFTAWTTLPREGRRVARRILLNQIWFTALQAIPLIVVLSSILSFLVISQAVAELGRLNATEFLGTLMVLAIVHELGPLLTALVVVSRSGTAIAAELATNTVMGEVRALEGMGIDPVHYLVLPRFAAAIVSVVALLVLFDVVAIVAGLVAATANGMAATRYFEVVVRSLAPTDVFLTLGKGLVFGLIVGIVPSWHGLAVRRGPTEVPIASSRAVVVSILGIFVAAALFVVIR